MATECCGGKIKGSKVTFWKRTETTTLPQSLFLRSPLTTRRERLIPWRHGHRKAINPVRKRLDAETDKARGFLVGQKKQGKKKRKTFLPSSGHSSLWYRYYCSRKSCVLLCIITDVFCSTTLRNSKERKSLPSYLFPLKWILMQPQLFQVFSSVSLFL